MLHSLGLCVSQEVVFNAEHLNIKECKMQGKEVIDTKPGLIVHSAAENSDIKRVRFRTTATGNSGYVYGQ